MLAFTTQNGITGSFTSSTGLLTLSGSATLANYQTALRSVTYQNTDTDNPSTAQRTVTFKVNDGDSDSNTQTRTIDVIRVNDAPTLASAETSALSFTEGGSATAITSALTVSDADDTNIESATVQITSNLDSSEDVLAFTTQNGITGSFTSSTGLLTLSGSATLANYQTALRSVTYQNTDIINPSILQRTVTFTVNDGDANSNSATRTINVAQVNDAPVAIDTTTTTDEDTAVTVTLSATDVDGDELSYTITGAPTNGSATISGNELAYTPNADYSGSDQVTFSVSDGQLAANANVDITINPVNDAPVAIDTTTTTDEDTAVTVTLSATDVDGDELTYTITGAPTNGSAAITGNELTYTPDADYSGSDQVTVSVSDGQLAANANVDITINPVNDAPVAIDTTTTTDEDTAVTVTLSATDVDGDELSYTITGAPADGEATIDGNELTYTPDADYNGSDQISVSVSDGQLAANANVDITINPVNDAPVAVDTTTTTDEDTAVTVTLSATDVDGDELTYTITGAPTNGSAAINGNEITYTPDADYSGSDQVTVSVSDGQLAANANVDITINPVNDAPVAVDTTTTTDEDTAVTVTLSATDVDGDELSYTITGAPTNGNAAITGNEITYTPDADYNGNDQVTVSVSDGQLAANANVDITINPVNDAPVAQDETTTDEDTAVTVTLSATDVDGDELTYTITGAPTNGNAAITGNEITYTPDADYNGNDQVTVSVSDGQLAANANVDITINPVNDAPIAQDETVTTDEDTAVTVTLSATDVDGDELTYTITGAPANGSAVINGNEITYTPNADYSGSDQIAVSVTDGQLAANANVDITINPVNDAPVAQDETVTTDEDTAVTVTLSATDVDGDELTYIITGAPANGSAAINGNEITYTPDADYNGSDQVTVSVSDGQLAANANVDITINPVNDAPVAQDETVTTDEDTAVTVTLSATDVDGDELTYIITGAPANGSAAISGNEITYTPDADYSGSDQVTVSVSDGQLAANANVDITINPVNDAPIAQDETVTTDEDTAVTVTLSATDVDGDELTYIITGAPANGSAAISGNEITYTPDADYSGSDQVTVSVSDRNANVDITINPATHPSRRTKPLPQTKTLPSPSPCRPPTSTETSSHTPSPAHLQTEAQPLPATNLPTRPTPTITAATRLPYPYPTDSSLPTPTSTSPSTP